MANQPGWRLRYFSIIVDRVQQMYDQGEAGVVAVTDEITARLLHWTPHGLGNRDLARLVELRNQAGELSGVPVSAAMEIKPVEPSDGYGVAVLALLGEAEPWPPGVVPLLTHLGSASASTPSARWEQTFTELARAVDAPGALTHTLLELLATAPAVPRVLHGTEVQPLLLYGNDDLARGLVWAAAILAEPWAPRTLQRVATRCIREAKGRTVRHVTVRGEKVPFACFYALVRIGTPDAMSVIGQFVQTLDNRTAVKRILEALAPVAAERDMTVDELLEQSIPDFELEADGSRRIPMVEGAVEIRLDDRSGATLALVSSTGETGDVPELVKDSEAFAEAEALWADIRKASRAERSRIESLLATRRRWELADFARSYVAHPMSGWFGRRLLWTVTTPSGERVVGLPADPDGRAVHVVGGGVRQLPPDAKVSLWHPVDADVDEVMAARDLLAAREVRQPFRQAWREAYRPDDIERGTELYSNRFAAHILRHKQFYALSKIRGWTNAYLSGAWDGGQAARCHRDFPDAGVRVVWLVGALDSDRSDVPVDLCVTDRLSFEALDDQDRTPIPITEIPDRALSEALRDLDLFVSTCTVANDYTWIERMHGERRLNEYWERVAAEGLGTTITLRRHSLDLLLRAGALDGPCELDDRFLTIRGNLGTYRIELATANVLLDPPGRWLSVNPRQPGSIDIGGPWQAALDDDEVLTRILARARILADDTRIRDKRLRDQIRSSRVD